MNSRRVFLEKQIDVSSSKILEIGALDSPMYKKTEFDVKFLDYASRFELSVNGKNNPRYKFENLAEVDFVCPSIDDYSEINEEFDLVIANHVIEHIPDTISWLNKINALLRNSGRLFLTVPDKRYTFDIKRNETTFIDLLRAYHDRVRKPDLYSILEHFHYHKSISASDIWKDNKELSRKLNQSRFYSIKELYKTGKKLSQLPYADVHCHVFTSHSFIDLIHQLKELDLIQFQIESSSEVKFMSNEFYVVLKN